MSVFDNLVSMALANAKNRGYRGKESSFRLIFCAI